MKKNETSQLNVGKADSREQSPAKDIQRITGVLKLLMNVVGDLLHPSLYHRLLLQVGERLGYGFQAESHLREPNDVSALSEYIENLLQSKGWDVSLVKPQQDGELEFMVRSCPFGKLGSQDHDVCLVEQGLIEGIASHFSSSTILTRVRGEGAVPCGCRLTLALDQSEKDLTDTVMHDPEADAGLRDALLVPNEISGSIGKLSRREREVLALIGDGLSDKSIADALGISARTVQGHGARIRHKLGVPSRTQLLRLSLLQKLSRH